MNAVADHEPGQQQEQLHVVGQIPGLSFAHFAILRVEVIDVEQISPSVRVAPSREVSCFSSKWSGAERVDDVSAEVDDEGEKRGQPIVAMEVSNRHFDQHARRELLR